MRRYLGVFLHVLGVEERVVNSEHYPVEQGAVQRFCHWIPHSHSLKEKSQKKKVIGNDSCPALKWILLLKRPSPMFIFPPRQSFCQLSLLQDNARDHTINPVAGGERERNTNIYTNYKKIIKNMCSTLPRSLKSLFGEKERGGRI